MASRGNMSDPRCGHFSLENGPPDLNAYEFGPKRQVRKRPNPGNLDRTSNRMCRGPAAPSDRSSRKIRSASSFKEGWLDRRGVWVGWCNCIVVSTFGASSRPQLFFWPNFAGTASATRCVRAFGLHAITDVSATSTLASRAKDRYRTLQSTTAWPLSSLYPLN
ncbi:hypothetical protein B0H16DRAFT_422284 [Mycena metata]|uniref:Uncharacterized protein n=1 Tax=Mycena metata TaxID=1033252 RepID=A0AAD7MI31_9AGAR|nr:hypothetical protein B0H16DRAFT_422284 [Mycena metata]